LSFLLNGQYMSKIFPNQVEIHIEGKSKEAVWAALETEIANESSWLSNNATIQGKRVGDILLISPNSGGQAIGQPKIKIHIQGKTVTLTTVPAKSIWFMPISLFILIALAVIMTSSLVFLIFLPIGLVFFYLMQWLFFSMNLAKANTAMDEIVRVIG